MYKQIWSPIRKASILVFEARIKSFELKIIGSFEIRVDMGVGDKIELGGTDLLSKEELLLISLWAEKLLAKKNKETNFCFGKSIECFAKISKFNGDQLSVC